MNIRELRDRMLPLEPEPLEVRDHILEEIEKRIVATGDGRRMLPFNRIQITLTSSQPSRRATLRRFLSVGGGIKENVVALCEAQHVDVDAQLSVEIVEDAA